MADSLTLDIPALPPTVNHYQGRNGKRTFLTKEAVAFNALVDSVAMRRKVEGKRFAVKISLGFMNKRRTDIDNRCKPMLDALVKAGVIADDHLIDVMTVKRCKTAQEMCSVTISAVTE